MTPSVRTISSTGDARELGGRELGSAREERVACRDGELQVDAAVLHRAGDRDQVVDELAEALAALPHHLGEHERHEQAVALAHVRGHADAAGLLAADEHVALDHLLVDPLEADGRGRDLEAEVAREAVDEHRGRERLDDAAGLALVLDEVPGDEADDAVRVHEVAVAVDRADAVGVAVGDERRVEAARRARGRAASSIRGGMGSGCRPPKPGLRSPWISVTSTPSERSVSAR